ncbi:MAG: hypothetical protein H8E31_12910 [Planctomycetes bacterium]|nr:hypothetical protein [Planctomycetota bacterium]
MLLSALLLVVLPAWSQEPDAAVQRDLDSRDPFARRAAALQVADLGLSGEAWLVKETTRGSSKRRRALLLAAALLGTPDSLQALADAARPGIRADEVRAFALLLYGVYHPQAPEAAADLFQRLRSPFERSCLLSGLLAQAQRVESLRDLAEAGRKSEPSLLALALVADALAGRRLPAEVRSDHEWSALLLSSVLPAGPELPAAKIVERRDRLLLTWSLAARRQPVWARSDLQREILSGSGGGVGLALLQSDPDQAAEDFSLLDARVSDPAVKGWLWGAAGDRGLGLPASADGQLPRWEVAGLVRLALRDPAAAAAAAAARRERARGLFQVGRPLEETWPAALVLALAPEKEDVDRLRQRVSEASGRDAQMLHTVWQLARGSTSSEQARRMQLRDWSRRLGASYLGYLDQEGPRWVAYLLVSGTRASEESFALATELSGLAGERDHSRDNELYADLLEYLLSGLYRWDLP